MDIALVEFEGGEREFLFVEKRGQRRKDLRMIELTDFPKLHCPFVRKTYKVDKEDWRKHGRALQLGIPERLATKAPRNEGTP